jgi:hypothetical protein
MAVTINRAPLLGKVNDSGANLDGSRIDKQFFIDTILDPIDAALALLLPLTGGGALQLRDRLTVQGASPGSAVAVLLANDPVTTTELLVFARSDSAVRGSIQTDATLGHLNIGTTSGHGFDLKTGGTVCLALSAAGQLQLPAYKLTTWVAGDKYLVIDAAGNVHRSAIGPGS